MLLGSEAQKRDGFPCNCSLKCQKPTLPQAQVTCVNSLTLALLARTAVLVLQPDLQDVCDQLLSAALH